MAWILQTVSVGFNTVSPQGEVAAQQVEARRLKDVVVWGEEK